MLPVFPISSFDNICWPTIQIECVCKYTIYPWKYLIPFSHHEFNHKNSKIRASSKNDRNTLNKRQTTAGTTKP